MSVSEYASRSMGECMSVRLCVCFCVSACGRGCVCVCVLGLQNTWEILLCLSGVEGRGGMWKFKHDHCISVCQCMYGCACTYVRLTNVRVKKPYLCVYVFEHSGSYLCLYLRLFLHLRSFTVSMSMSVYLSESVSVVACLCLCLCLCLCVCVCVCVCVCNIRDDVTLAQLVRARHS